MHVIPLIVISFNHIIQEYLITNRPDVAVVFIGTFCFPLFGSNDSRHKPVQECKQCAFTFVTSSSKVGNIKCSKLCNISCITDVLALNVISTIFYDVITYHRICLLYTSPSPRDGATSRMPSSA